MSKEKWKKGTKKGKPVGVIESAYVIPPSMIRDLASDEVISIWPQSDDNVDVPVITEALVRNIRSIPDSAVCRAVNVPTRKPQ